MQLALLLSGPACTNDAEDVASNAGADAADDCKSSSYRIGHTFEVIL
jgi:hypothetical protein